MTTIKIALGLMVLVILYLGALSWATRQHPVRTDRSIPPCPGKPNCVSSSDSRQKHQVAPLALRSSGPDESWQRLIRSIDQAGGKILINDGRYCHAVFTSTLFRFHDDFEAALKDDHIEIRSESRAGTSDLGVNRKRIEELRTHYQQAEERNVADKEKGAK